MIKYINEEPFLKKMLLILICFFLLSALIFMLVQNYELNVLHKQQIKNTQALVGKLAEIYPEKENDIVKALFNDNYKSIESLGEDILDKYGYNLDTNISQDVLFKDYYARLKIANYICITFIGVGVIIFCIYCMAMFFRRLERLSFLIDNIIEGNLPEELNNTSEGIISRINNKLYDSAKAMKLKLWRLNCDKGNLKSLVTDISHQLKTPLSSIKIYNSLLSEEDTTKEEQKDFILRSELEVNKLQWLVDSLIKISRLEAGMISLKKEKFNLKETLIKAINGIYTKALEKRITINLDNLEDYFINHDEKWTKEAIFNVLENAVKYTENNGIVNISIDELTSYLRIDIEDSGIGIEKSEFNNIFKRFYRANNEKIKNIEGSGVGLYLTRKILEEQGGCITVDSTIGKGTTFSLFLQKCNEL